MTIKLFIPKIVFDPELGKRQEIWILLNEKNELPSINTIDDAYKILGIKKLGMDFMKMERHNIYSQISHKTKINMMD